MLAKRQGCWNPDERFKPQWAYKTPEGWKDQDWYLNFHFTFLGDGLLVRQLPWSNDDDYTFMLRGIVFSELNGDSQIQCRIWDTHGNPLSDGLALTLGAWGFSPDSDHSNAFGFPIEPEIESAPGGVFLFDFIAPFTGAPAEFDLTDSGTRIRFVAAVSGTAGNADSIQLINPGAPSIGLSVAVVGTAVQVTLATNGASTIISTYGQVVAAINANTVARVLMYAQVSVGNPNLVASALGVSPLTDGSNELTNIDLAGTFIGVKRFRECL